MSSADLRFYLYIFSRRLPLFLLVVTVVSAAGLYVAVSLAPVYRATSIIMVEAPEIPTDLARSTASGSSLTRFQVIHQELQTQEALLALAQRHRIYEPPPIPTTSAIVDDMRSRILLEPVHFGGSEGALGFSVSFEAPTPELAARVANDLASILLERDAGNRTARAAATLKFFEDDVSRMARGVAAIEARLQAYKSQNLQALPDSLEFRRAQQLSLQDRALDLEREQASLHSRRASHVLLYETTGRTADASVQSPEQKLLQDLQLALVSQRARFRDDSPAIAALVARIGVVEADLKTQPTKAHDARPSAFDLQLAEIDNRLEVIKAERASVERTYGELGASIEATPANEIELNALEREYANEQTLYNAAIARLAEASTGEQIELRFKGERLTLVEPALPPDRPIRPQRFRVAAAGGIIGIVAALALIVGLELVNGRIRRPVEVQRALAIEPMTTIPYMPNLKHFGRRRPPKAAFHRPDPRSPEVAAS